MDFDIVKTYSIFATAFEEGVPRMYVQKDKK